MEWSEYLGWGAVLPNGNQLPGQGSDDIRNSSALRNQSTQQKGQCHFPNQGECVCDVGSRRLCRQFDQDVPILFGVSLYQGWLSSVGKEVGRRPVHLPER